MLPKGAVRSAGPDAARLVQVGGVVLDEWQTWVLDTSMGLLPDDSWAAKTNDLLVSRQNGKNEIVHPREIYGAMILGESVLHTAHEFKTAKKSFGRIKTILRADDDLWSQLARQPYESAASGYLFEFRSGGQIEFIARSTSSGRGFTGDVLVIDEAQEARDEHLGALLPALSATSMQGDPQIWYLGSAPDLTSEVWQRRRHAGRTGAVVNGSYFEWSAHPDTDLDDRDGWAAANPGLNVRISEGFIESVERTSMSDEEFARERLGISPDLIGDDGVLPGWSRVCDPEASFDMKDVRGFAFDVNPEHTAAAIVAVGPGPILEVVEHRPGTWWLVDRIVELRQEYHARFAVDASGPAGSFIDELTRKRVRLVELDGRKMVRACGWLQDQIPEQGFTVRQDTGLDLAVIGAKKRPVGDAWTWGRKNSKVDITPLVCVTVGLKTFGSRGKPQVVDLAAAMRADVERRRREAQGGPS